MAKPSYQDYNSDEGHKKAHTPKFPSTHAYYKKMRGEDKPDDLPGPIIHDDRNPTTEEPFTPIFSWILKEAMYLLNAINSKTNDTAYQAAVTDFENFVGYLNNRDPACTPTPPAGRTWAKVWPTISEAAIEPVFSGGNLSGAIVTVTWLGGTHTSSSSTSS